MPLLCLFPPHCADRVGVVLVVPEAHFSLDVGSPVQPTESSLCIVHLMVESELILRWDFWAAPAKGENRDFAAWNTKKELVPWLHQRCFETHPSSCTSTKSQTLIIWQRILPNMQSTGIIENTQSTQDVICSLCCHLLQDWINRRYCKGQEGGFLIPMAPGVDENTHMDPASLFLPKAKDLITDNQS